MSPVTPFPDLEAAREAAATWIARAFRGLTPEEHAELREWSARPVNRRALQEMSSVWEGLDVLSALAEAKPPAVRGSPRKALAVAAGLVALASGAAWLVANFALERSAPRVALSEARLEAQAYSSAVGEHRSIPLRDGSVLALNSDTLVEVTFSPGLRSLTLHRGEAHFEVAHDAARPFLVTVGSHTLSAIGTAFNVRRRAEGTVDVLVTEGVVSSWRSDMRRTDAPGAPATAARLNAGQLLHVGPDGSERLSTLNAAQMDALTAWRRGVLVLDGITLAAAMDEMARYTRQRIVIADPALRDLRLGGSLRVDDLDEMTRALRAGFGIEAHDDEDGTLRLTRAATAARP